MLTRKIQRRLEIVMNKLLEDVETFVKFQKTNSRGFICPGSLAETISGATDTMVSEYGPVSS